MNNLFINKLDISYIDTLGNTNLFVGFKVSMNYIHRVDVYDVEEFQPIAYFDAEIWYFGE